MLRISKKLMFAIEAVLDIAYNAGSEPVQSGEITRRQGIPKRYLEQVLQQLVRAGVLAGVRGPRGGYRLARERRRINIGEIVRVVRAMETASDPVEEPTGLHPRFESGASDLDAIAGRLHGAPGRDHHRGSVPARQSGRNRKRIPQQNRFQHLIPQWEGIDYNLSVLLKFSQFRRVE